MARDLELHSLSKSQIVPLILNRLFSLADTRWFLPEIYDLLDSLGVEEIEIVFTPLFANHAALELANMNLSDFAPDVWLGVMPPKRHHVILDDLQISSY